MLGIRTSGSLAISCFKAVEGAADRLTGAAGPVFMAICWVLIAVGGFSFTDVILLRRPLSFSHILLGPLSVLILSNLYSQYYYATVIPPGNPENILREVEKEAAWMLSASVRRSAQSESQLFSDGTWAGERLRKCGKCKGPKPLRTHHCKVCRSCVLMMDHHCP